MLLRSLVEWPFPSFAIPWKNKLRWTPLRIRRMDVKCLMDTLKRPLADGRFQLARPHDDHIPAEGLPFFFMPFVPGYVFLPFLLPERHVRLWHRRIATGMTMPEAATDFNQRMGARNDDVRMAWQFFVTNAITPSSCEKTLPNEHFRFRIPRSDTRHDFRSLFLCHRVHIRHSSFAMSFAISDHSPLKRRIRRMSSNIRGASLKTRSELRSPPCQTTGTSAIVPPAH